MIATNLRYPKIEIEIITEDSKHLIKYDTGDTITQNDLMESMISFSVKNSMEDDSPVFSLVILAKDRWDMALVSNDMIRIKIDPKSENIKVRNPYIMVGLISEIQKEGEYEDGMLLYRITGRAMTKALIDFEVGLINEIPLVIGDIGWLPDSPEGGITFTGNSASGIAEELINRFIQEYAKYHFEGDRGLNDFLIYSFDSWTEDEALADVTPFINYEGSILQFLTDIAEKPFNELFFEYTDDGKCITIMRRTPFDPDEWSQLPVVEITSDSVAEESFGKSDSEMYTLFVVQAQSMIEFTSVELGVYPQYHPDLIEKYGYKRLDASNRYLLSQGLETIAEAGEETGGMVIDSTDEERTDASTQLQKFTNKLFNWYAENANFYSGDIRVIGSPDYRVGSVLVYEDFETDSKWEFYIESVQHEFSYTEGYTTILGVTRGLPNEGADRFTNLWNQAEDFKGGYLGEPTLDELMEQINQANQSGGAIDSNYVGTGTGAPNFPWSAGSPFGYRVHPITGKNRLHAGIDYPAPSGSQIHATAGGVVTQAGTMGGYGQTVIVKSGSLEMLYAHMSRILVQTGQKVQPGTLIGLVGSTGASTGPHLHYETRIGGKPVNPNTL